METTGVGTICICKIDYAITMTIESMTRGSMFPQTIQILETTCAQYALSQDSMNNIVM